MELLFNELSTTPCSADIYQANEKMKSFVETVSLVRKKGGKLIRSEKELHEIELSKNYYLSNWLISKDVDRNYKDLMYGMIITPFIKDEDIDLVDRYIEGNCYFEDLVFEYPKTKCEGLMAAHLYKTISISLNSAPIWSQEILNIVIENGSHITNERVLNICTKESMNAPLIFDFFENLAPVQLILTTISPKDKKVHLTDHHGKSELKKISDQLIENPHVVEILSCEWGGKRFIRKVHQDGRIEIVLHRSDREYAIIVKSTGRNLKETEKIASLLRDKYDK